MRNISFSSRKRQAGMGLMDIILWVALVAIVIAGIMYFAKQAMGSVKAGSEVQYFASMLNDAKKKFGEQGTFTGVTANVMIQSGSVPSKMINGTAIRSSWGTPITVASANYNSGTNNAVSFTYSVPQVACSDFSAAAGSSVARATVGGTVVKDVAAGKSTIDVAALNAACAAGTANVAVVLIDGL